MGEEDGIEADAGTRGGDSRANVERESGRQREGGREREIQRGGGGQLERGLRSLQREVREGIGGMVVGPVEGVKKVLSLLALLVQKYKH